MNDISPPTSPSISPGTSPGGPFTSISPSSMSGSPFSQTSAKLPPSIPDSSTAVLSNSNFFSLIIDIENREEPFVIFQRDCQEDLSLFIDYLSKLKIPQKKSKTKFSTSLFQYSFDKTFFAAFFFDIADFTLPSLHRQLVLIFGHQDRTLLVNAFNHFKKQFLRFIQRLQYISFLQLNRHKSEIIPNIISEDDILQILYFSTKFDDLTNSLLEKLSNDSALSEFNHTQFEKITYFSVLFEAELNILIDSLPKSQFLGYIQMRSILRSNGTKLHFGQFNTIPDFISFIQTPKINSSIFRLLDLVDSGALFHSIFSILSGRTLVIKSSRSEEVLFLGKKLSLFIPFYNEHLFAQLDKITVADALQYSIVIVKEFPPEIHGELSLLDLDNRMYKGESCPHKSFVWTTGQKATKSNEASFLVTLFREVKRTAGKLSIMLSNVFTSRDDLKDLIISNGLHIDDEPLFKYWIACASNQETSRPILTNNRSKFGVILTAI